MAKDELEAPVETEERKPSPPPHQKEDRVRVCGKWREKGYRPTKAEQEQWLVTCKNKGRDPKTGKLLKNQLPVAGEKQAA